MHWVAIIAVIAASVLVAGSPAAGSDITVDTLLSTAPSGDKRLVLSVPPHGDPLLEVVRLSTQHALSPDHFVSLLTQVSAVFNASTGGEYSLSLPQRQRAAVVTVDSDVNAASQVEIELGEGDDPDLVAAQWCQALAASDVACTHLQSTLRNAAIINARERRRFSKLLAGGVRYMSLGGEDEWVAEAVFKGKRGGFFVDVGAGDGVTRSATLALEAGFGWRGICIEPSHEAGSTARGVFGPSGTIGAVSPTAAALYRRQGCLWDPSVLAANVSMDGHTRFVDVTAAPSQLVPLGAPWLLSGLWGTVVDVDGVSGTARGVRTVTLSDVLDAFRAPEYIEYLKLGTGGSEAQVLRGIDFDRYRFGAISVTCDNNEDSIEGIHDTLLQAGYQLAFMGSRGRSRGYLLGHGGVAASGGRVAASLSSTAGGDGANSRTLVARLRSAGLGARLQGLVAAMVMAQATSRRLEVDWRPSARCDSELEALLANPVPRHGAVATCSADHMSVDATAAARLGSPPWCVQDSRGRREGCGCTEADVPPVGRALTATPELQLHRAHAVLLGAGGEGVLHGVGQPVFEVHGEHVDGSAVLQSTAQSVVVDSVQVYRPPTLDCAAFDDAVGAALRAFVPAMDVLAVVDSFWNEAMRGHQVIGVHLPLRDGSGAMDDGGAALRAQATRLATLLRRMRDHAAVHLVVASDAGAEACKVLRRALGVEGEVATQRSGGNVTCLAEYDVQSTVHQHGVKARAALSDLLLLSHADIIVSATTGDSAPPLPKLASVMSRVPLLRVVGEVVVLLEGHGDAAVLLPDSDACSKEQLSEELAGAVGRAWGVEVQLAGRR